MTVGELIKQLSAFDPNALVMVDGYEWGCQLPVVRTEHVEYDGCGDYGGPWQTDADPATGTFAVIVGRR
jgi:hypothetical protein